MVTIQTICFKIFVLSLQQTAIITIKVLTSCRIEVSSVKYELNFHISLRTAGVEVLKILHSEFW